MSEDLVTELRLIGCHQNGDARCTCNVGQEAADRIEAQAARIAAMEAEQDKLLATAKNVVNLIEGLDGHGLARSVLDETRLKDEPRWVFFYNEVAAQFRAALAETEGE